ncbi:uncharacterized protein LOC122659420 [Telopea speciosissima]|uniref:uncharacterized protein LOC122659420 n=1 Tax=Telopea speciosissima TaxID=54955 RepID=UPI001CC58592|nr:uncharacterized protein LOC122659420 [Telopea speciosissima]
MDSQDHRKNHTTGHESHVAHVCPNCGWPFPNPHPSAKLRRAHKKVCGTLEGYKLTDAEHKAQLDVAGEDQLSDEDQKASENSELGELKSNENGKNGILKSKSSRSEEEVFPDAVAELGDTVTNPTIETVVSKGIQNADVNVNANIIQEPEHPMQVSQLQNPQDLKSSVDNLKNNVQFQDDTSSSTNGSVLASSDKKTKALAVDATEGRPDAANLISDVKLVLALAVDSTEGRDDSANLILDVKPEELVNVIPKITNTQPGDDLTDRSMKHSGQSSEGQQHGNSDADGHLPPMVLSPSKPVSVMVSGIDSKLEQMNELGVTTDFSTTRTNDSVPVDKLVDSKEEQSNFSESITIEMDSSSNFSSGAKEVVDIEQTSTFTNRGSDASGQEVDIVYPGETVDGHNMKAEPNEKVAAHSIPTVIPVESLSEIKNKDRIDHGQGTTDAHDEVIKEMVDHPKSLTAVADDSSFLRSESDEGDVCSAQPVLEDHQKQGTVSKSIVEQMCIDKTDTSECKVETSPDDGSNGSEVLPDALSSDKTCTHGDQSQMVYSTEKQEILPERLIYGTGGAAMVSPAENEVDGASDAISSSNFPENATISTADGSDGSGANPDALGSDITFTHTGLTQIVRSIEKHGSYDSHHDLSWEIPPEKPTVIQETGIASMVSPADTEVDEANNAFSNSEFPENATISTGNRSNGLEALPDSEILQEKPTVIPESGPDAMVSPAHFKVDGASHPFSSSDDFPEKARTDNSNLAGKYVAEGVAEVIGATNLMIAPKFAAELSNTEPHLNTPVIRESDKNVLICEPTTPDSILSELFIAK